jgi:FAD dependent oxidoreductase
MTAAIPSAPPTNTRTYDLICFGDEVHGVLGVVAFAREFRRRLGRLPRTLVMLKNQAKDGLGGHLVRGGLAYLDRSYVPVEVRNARGLPTFGEPVVLYQEFLRRSQVSLIALDPKLADAALRQMLKETGTEILSQCAIAAVPKTGQKITGITLTNGITYQAQAWIDCTVNAELAQKAGVSKLPGFACFDLPEAELPVGLIFETEGLTPQQLAQVELTYLKRLTNPTDAAAQNLINVAAGSDRALAEVFRKDLIDAKGNYKCMHVASDHIDVRCRALSITYHAFRGKKLSLVETGMVVDQANIAVLSNNRLSWNSLLFKVTGSQAEAIARSGAKPTPPMLEEMKFVERWARSLGATAVRAFPELYIRHAGNIIGAVETLSGATMMAGGVADYEALGTFGYHLDIRGGIEGLGLKASGKGLGSISFHHPPLFNIGIRHALVLNVPNLAVIGPGAGFDGYACAAGRIVEFNVGVAQGVGIAAAIALHNNRDLAQIGNWEVCEVLEQTRQRTRIYGQSYAEEATRLRQFETAFA